MIENKFKEDIFKKYIVSNFLKFKNMDSRIYKRLIVML